MTTFRTLDDAGDLKGKRVLVRVDLNVPMADGKVADDTRIRASAPTIREIAEKGGKAILLAHFGRPKDGPDPKFSLKPVVPAVEAVLGRPVAFADDCVGPVAETAVSAMKDGDVLVLENTRFHKGEEKNDPLFTAALAKLGDIYVNDAFSAAHRAHASTEGLANHLPAYAGRAMQAEIEALEAALGNPKRPVVAIVGGAKVSSKIDVLGHLVQKVDALVIGGGMANTFLLAKGVAIGKSLAEPDLADTAKRITRGCRQGRLDDRPAGRRRGRVRVEGGHRRRDDPRRCRSRRQDDPRRRAEIDRRRQRLDRPARRRWCGTARSALSRCRRSTRRRSPPPATPPNGRRPASCSRSPAAATPCRRSIRPASPTAFSFVSTAGGAFLEWLEGKALPGVEVLRKRS